MRNRSRNMGLLVKAVHIAEQGLSTRINRTLAPLALNRSQLSILAHFSSQPNKSQTITSIVAVVELNQPAVTKIVSYLIGQSWLIAESDAGDARKRSLKITAQGLGVVMKAYRELTPAIDALLEVLSDEEVATLHALLNRISRSA